MQNLVEFVDGKTRFGHVSRAEIESWCTQYRNNPFKVQHVSRATMCRLMQCYLEEYLEKYPMELPAELQDHFLNENTAEIAPDYFKVIGSSEEVLGLPHEEFMKTLNAGVRLKNWHLSLVLSEAVNGMSCLLSDVKIKLKALDEFKAYSDLI